MITISLFNFCENSYECINDWEKFYETFSPEKEEFYSHLTMEGITHADYAMQKECVKILN